MTVGELCKTAGVSVEDLAAFCVNGSPARTQQNHSTKNIRRETIEPNQRTSSNPTRSAARSVRKTQTDDDAILAFLNQSRREMSQQEIHTATGRSLLQVRAALKRLVDAGSVGAEGQTVRRRFRALSQSQLRR